MFQGCEKYRNQFRCFTLLVIGKDRVTWYGRVCLLFNLWRNRILFYSILKRWGTFFQWQNLPVIIFGDEMVLRAGAGERRVRRDRDAAPVAVLAQRALLEVRVQLHLQHLRLHFRRFEDPLDLGLVEIGYPQVTDQPFVLTRLHCLWNVSN